MMNVKRWNYNHTDTGPVKSSEVNGTCVCHLRPSHSCHAIFRLSHLMLSCLYWYSVYILMYYLYSVFGQKVVAYCWLLSIHRSTYPAWVSSLFMPLFCAYLSMNCCAWQFDLVCFFSVFLFSSPSLCISGIEHSFDDSFMPMQWLTCINTTIIFQIKLVIVLRNRNFETQRTRYIVENYSIETRKIIVTSNRFRNTVFIKLASVALLLVPVRSFELQSPMLWL